MIKLKVLDLDVWGNEKDGFEINNWLTIGVIEFPRKTDAYDIKVSSIKKKLVTEGYLVSSAIRKVELDDCSSMSFFYQVLEKKTGRPLYQIEVAND